MLLNQHREIGVFLYPKKEVENIEKTNNINNPNRVIDDNNISNNSISRLCTNNR